MKNNLLKTISYSQTRNSVHVLANLSYFDLTPGRNWFISRGNLYIISFRFVIISNKLIYLLMLTVFQ